MHLRQNWRDAISIGMYAGLIASTPCYSSLFLFPARTALCLLIPNWFSVTRYRLLSKSGQGIQYRCGTRNIFISKADSAVYQTRLNCIYTACGLASLHSTIMPIFEVCNHGIPKPSRQLCILKIVDNLFTYFVCHTAHTTVLEHPKGHRVSVCT